jgi:hypothetical protein
MDCLLTFTVSSLKPYCDKEKIMIEFMKMTPQEAYEAHNHFILHDMADLCLKDGFEPTMEKLIAIINEKVDRLEPV